MPIRDLQDSHREQFTLAGDQRFAAKVHPDDLPESDQSGHDLEEHQRCVPRSFQCQHDQSQDERRVSPFSQSETSTETIVHLETPWV